MYELNKVLSRPVLINFYHVYFQSIVIIAWNCTPDAARGFKLQKRAVRWVVSVKKRSNWRKIFNEIWVLSLSLYFLFVIDTKSNQKITRTFNFNHRWITRKGDVMEMSNLRLKLYENRPHFNSINVYNKYSDYYKHW